MTLTFEIHVGTSRAAGSRATHGEGISAFAALTPVKRHVSHLMIPPLASPPAAAIARWPFY